MTTMLDVGTAIGIRAACSSACAVGPAWRAHHDRLLRIEHDPDELVELMELALTWGELEYDTDTVIGPELWAGFAATHHWADPERAGRIFGLAIDIAARGVPRVHAVTPAA